LAFIGSNNSLVFIPILLSHVAIRLVDVVMHGWLLDGAYCNALLLAQAHWSKTKPC